MSYVPPVVVSALAALLLFTGTARAAEQQYQMHFLAVSCFIGPCPDWQVIDPVTGEKFVALIDLSAIANPPSSSNDLLVEARRVRRERPNGGGSYEVLAITAILKTTPAVPGYQR
jgi:hypothetical protein